MIKPDTQTAFKTKFPSYKKGEDANWHTFWCGPLVAGFMYLRLNAVGALTMSILLLSQVFIDLTLGMKFLVSNKSNNPQQTEPIYIPASATSHVLVLLSDPDSVTVNFPQGKSMIKQNVPGKIQKYFKDNSTQYAIVGIVCAKPFGHGADLARRPVDMGVGQLVATVLPEHVGASCQSAFGERNNRDCSKVLAQACEKHSRNSSPSCQQRSK